MIGRRHGRHMDLTRRSDCRLTELVPACWKNMVSDCSSMRFTNLGSL